MPILDVIAFEQSEDIKTSTLQNFLETLKKYDGIIRYFSREKCLLCNLSFSLFGTSAWHVFRLTEVSQSSCYPSQLPTTLPFAESSLQRNLFDINQYTGTALMTPITDLTCMFLKGKPDVREWSTTHLRTVFWSAGNGGTGSVLRSKFEGMSIILIGYDSILSSLLVSFTCLMLSAGALRWREYFLHTKSRMILQFLL